MDGTESRRPVADAQQTVATSRPMEYGLRTPQFNHEPSGAGRQPLRSLRLTRGLPLYGVNGAAPMPTTSSDNPSPSTWITTK